MGPNSSKTGDKVSEPGQHLTSHCFDSPYGTTGAAWWRPPSTSQETELDIARPLSTTRCGFWAPGIPLGPLACPATTHGVEITWSCTLKVIYVENDEECVQNGGRVVQMQTSAWKAELYMYCLGHIPVRASGGVGSFICNGSSVQKKMMKKWKRKRKKNTHTYTVRTYTVGCTEAVS